MTAQSDNTKVLKNTLAIGASQITQMLLVLIRAKVIALILGPIGIGIYSILISILMVIQQIGAWGIFQSGVRELSLLHANNINEYTHARKSFLNVSIASGILGCLIMAILSPVLSSLFSDDKNITQQILICALALIFFSPANGYNALLQSSERVTQMAKASVKSSFAGVLISTILIYLLKDNGIPLSIICSYLFMCIFSGIAENKGEQKYWPRFFNLKKLYSENKTIIASGGYLMVGTFSILLFTFIINVIVGQNGITEVGLYQAAASIMSQGLVICSMILASDFYPRLSKASNNQIQVNRSTNQEIKLLSLIIIPISGLIILLAPFIVRILYTPEFQAVSSMIRIMALSLVFRILWMTFSYVILSKGDSKRYLFFDCFIGNGLNFILCTVGYELYGLDGITWAWPISSAVIAAILGVIIHKLYKVNINCSILFFPIFGFLILLVITILLLFYAFPISISISAIAVIILIGYSVLTLKRETNILDILFKNR